MTTDITNRLFFVLTIASTLFSCSLTDPAFDASGDIEKGKVRLISYGFSMPLPPPYTNYNRQVDSLRKVYGIEYDDRGCQTDSILLAKMNDYNKIVIAHLAKRNGDNWYDKYQRQVDSLYKLVKNPLFVQVDTTREVEGDLFYQFIQATDSTAFIKWGNRTITNTSKTDLFSAYLEKERISIRWFNSKFMVLARGTGSDTWIHIVLPLTKDADLKFYENCMAFDKENGIAVREWYIESDTVLLAENIITGKKQALGKDWKKCGAASFFHYCIDSISVTNKTLYVEWVLPHKIEKQTTKETKRIKLDV